MTTSEQWGKEQKQQDQKEMNARKEVTKNYCLIPLQWTKWTCSDIRLETQRYKRLILTKTCSFKE